MFAQSVMSVRLAVLQMARMSRIRRLFTLVVFTVGCLLLTLTGLEYRAQAQYGCNTEPSCYGCVYQYSNCFYSSCCSFFPNFECRYQDGYCVLYGDYCYREKCGESPCNRCW